MKNKKYDLYDLFGYSDDKTYVTFKDSILKRFDKFDSKYKNYWYDTSETVSTEDPETVRLKKLAAERERKIDSILS